MNMKKILAIDLEMTCWNEPTDNKSEIIQIGVVEIDIIKREISRKKMMYVKPEESEISDFCTELTGITKKQVYKQGLSYEKAIEVLNTKFGFKNKVIYAWGRDDKIFRDGIEQYVNFGALYSLLKGTDKKYNLEEALKEENISFNGNAHDALVDAENMASLILHVVHKTTLSSKKEDLSNKGK